VRRKPRGPKPHPPVRLTAEFIAALKATGYTSRALASVAGLRTPRFSHYLHASRINGTPLVRRRLATLAAAIHFPPERAVEETR